MKKIIFCIIALAATAGCKKDLTLYPEDKLKPENAFKTEQNLQLYVNGFYRMLPDGSAIVRADNMSDYMVYTGVNNYLSGNYNSGMAGGWSWNNLTNINTFLANMGQAQIGDADKKHFEGLARFFRAWFYFDKVKQFGDVPYFDHVLKLDDPDLYRPRDKRADVMEKVYADLKFAAENIREAKDVSSSQVNRAVAAGFLSRVCLFEGTWRKYHPETGLTSSANTWLQRAADAARQVIDSKLYSVNVEGDNQLAYRNLFINETPKTNEVMLAAVGSTTYRIFHDANWFFTSATYGSRLSFTKTFINTFLNRDGSRFTDQQNYNQLTFPDEVKNRDLRLQQTIRVGAYQREGLPAPPDFTYTFTGYQPLKFTLDAKRTDGLNENANSLPIMRYAEILLNYAEAKAELGTFSAADWNLTVKPLRERAGLTNTEMPTRADGYLQANYFPEISNATLLEIRRERGIELSMEGFRLADLYRWNKGKLLTITWDGIYVPAMDTPYDLNGDGTPDVMFVTKVPANQVRGVAYVIVDGKINKLSNGTSGILQTQINVVRKFEDYQYLNPIPQDAITRSNGTLTQNPGWN